MGKSILLITYSLSRTGAPMVLLNMAIEFKNLGYVPVVLSNADGDLRKDILNSGIAVAIEPDLCTDTYRLLSWVRRYDFAVINTVLYYKAVKHLKDEKQKIIWWIHESENYYENITADSSLYNVTVCGVGKIACDNFYKTFKIYPYNLFYGVREDSLVQKERYDNRMVFALIGRIGYRKGIDIFLDAFELLPVNYRESICVLIIGGREEGEDDLYERLLQMADVYPEIQVVGELDQKSLVGAYSGLDMLLLPSREDPMPVVFAEAALNQIPSIVSTGCGTVELLQDGVNGYVIEKNSPKELARKIMYAYDHRDNIAELGKEAKVIFERYFSMDIFRNNLKKLLKEALWEE